MDNDICARRRPIWAQCFLEQGAKALFDTKCIGCGRVAIDALHPMPDAQQLAPLPLEPSSHAPMDFDKRREAAPDNDAAFAEAPFGPTSKPMIIADDYFVEMDRLVALETIPVIDWSGEQAASTGQELTELSAAIFQQNIRAGWWTNLATGDSIVKTRNRPEMLMLIVSEIAEGMEGFRKSKKDDHLPHRDMLEVELADAVIRIMDLSAACGYNLGAAMMEKLAYNQQRQDHKVEVRMKDDGKKF